MLAAAAALSCALLALVVLPAAPARAAGEDEATIAGLVTAARQDAGLPPLARNDALDDVAAAWARRMADDRRMYHNPLLAAQVPGGWRALGENVAQGYADAAAVHDGWMHSTGHRANILGEGYTDIGIAFLRAGGTTWGVEVFATYPDGSAGAAARAPAEEPEPDEPKPADEPDEDAPSGGDGADEPRSEPTTSRDATGGTRASRASSRPVPATTAAPDPTPTPDPEPSPSPSSTTPAPTADADDLPTLGAVYPLLDEADATTPEPQRGPALPVALAVGLPAAVAVGGAGSCALVAARRARLDTPGRHRR